MTSFVRILAAGAVAALAIVVTPPLIARPVIGPLRIVLLVDSSAAMASMINSFRASLLAFIDALPGSDQTIDSELTMISTGGQLRIRVPTTTDRETLKRAAAAFAPDGGSNAFLDTMLEADNRFLKTAPERRSVLVILITDRGGNRGEARIDAYNRFARQFFNRGGRAHGIVVRETDMGVNSDIVTHITRRTGGYFSAIAIANALPEKMKDVAAMVAADIP